MTGVQIGGEDLVHIGNRSPYLSDCMLDRLTHGFFGWIAQAEEGTYCGPDLVLRLQFETDERAIGLLDSIRRVAPRFHVGALPSGAGPRLLMPWSDRGTLAGPPPDHGVNEGARKVGSFAHLSKSSESEGEECCGIASGGSPLHPEGLKVSVRVIDSSRSSANLTFTLLPRASEIAGISRSRRRCGAS